MVVILGSLDGVVVYTDLSGKDLYRQEGVGRVVTSGSLRSVMVMPASHCSEVDSRLTTKCEFLKFLILVYS